MRRLGNIVFQMRQALNQSDLLMLQKSSKRTPNGVTEYAKSYRIEFLSPLFPVISNLQGWSGSHGSHVPFVSFRRVNIFEHGLLITRQICKFRLAHNFPSMTPHRSNAPDDFNDESHS